MPMSMRGICVPAQCGQRSCTSAQYGLCCGALAYDAPRDSVLANVHTESEEQELGDAAREQLLVDVVQEAVTGRPVHGDAAGPKRQLDVGARPGVGHLWLHDGLPLRAAPAVPRVGAAGFSGTAQRPILGRG